MSRPPVDVKTKIKQYADLDGYCFFKTSTPTKLIGMRVFDVGQGDCVGLLDEHNDVVAYVDYGGCIRHPENYVTGYKTSKELPVSRSSGFVTIVLTHWDKDHYWSATKHADAEKCQWLVPRQFVSPTAARFSARLKDVQCWPESHGNKVHRFNVGQKGEIEVRKCQRFDRSHPSEDRNLTGLVVILIRKDAIGNDESAMLLPGDCPFDRIPSPPTAAIRALLAYHHGSHVHWKIPRTGNKIANRSGYYTMVYSFGDPNPYRHPDRDKYKPHWNANRYETPILRASGYHSVDIRW